MSATRGAGAAGVVAGPARRWPWPVLGGAAFVVVATLAQVLRQAGEPMWRTVWAEDLVVFWSDAAQAPVWEVLLDAHAGYAHVAPRLLAAIGVALPLGWYAAWVTWSSAVIVSLLALFTYRASAPLLRSPLRQGVLAASTLLLPVLPWEVLGAICNVQWFVALPCLLALLFPVERPGSVASRAVVATLGPLTAPLAVLLSPLAAWRVVEGVRRRRGGEAWPVARSVVPGLYLAASAVQLAVYVLVPSDQPVGDDLSLPDNVVRLLVTRVGADLVAGARLTEALWPSWGYLVAALAVVVLVGLFTLKLRSVGERSQRWVLALAALAVASFVAQLLPRWPELTADAVPGAAFATLGSRWAIFPSLLLVLALLVPPELPGGLLTRVEPPPPAAPAPGAGAAAWGAWLTRGKPWVAVAVVAAAWLAVAVVPSYRQVTARSGAPPWPAQAEVVDEVCALGPDAVVELVAAPSWPVLRRCEQLP